jgi:hypothetical protein
MRKWNPTKINPLSWLGHCRKFKLEWKSHSWLIIVRRDASIRMLAPRMISMQTAKLGIVANPLCSMDDVQANYKVKYCCKFAIFLLFPCKLCTIARSMFTMLPDGFQCAKWKFEVLLLWWSEHVLDEDCHYSNSRFAKFGYCNDPP